MSDGHRDILREEKGDGWLEKTVVGSVVSCDSMYTTQYDPPHSRPNLDTITYLRICLTICVLQREVKVCVGAARLRRLGISGGPKALNSINDIRGARVRTNVETGTQSSYRNEEKVGRRKDTDNPVTVERYIKKRGLELCERQAGRPVQRKCDTFSPYQIQRMNIMQP